MITLKTFKLNEFNISSYPTAVALGCFDGLHIGHTEVINAAVKFGSKHKLKSAVFKLESAKIGSIITYDETLKILQSQGVDLLLLQLLDNEFMNLSCEDFVENYLYKRLRASFVSVGYNYHFGKGAAGNAETLGKLCAQYGIEVEIIPPICVDKVVVSSTKIRELLKNGDISTVSKYIGRRWHG